MSGGHFNRQEFQLEYVTEQIAEDNFFRKDCPLLAKVLPNIGKVMRNIIRDYDYHISGDTIIRDMQAFEKDAIKLIHTIIFDCLNEKYND